MLEVFYFPLLHFDKTFLVLTNFISRLLQQLLLFGLLLLHNISPFVLISLLLKLLDLRMELMSFFLSCGVLQLECLLHTLVLAYDLTIARAAHWLSCGWWPRSSLCPCRWE